MKKRLIILFCVLTTTCFSQTDSIIQQKYYEMYRHASGKVIKGDTIYQTISTAPYYVIINVTDLKTGITKELCTEYPFIEGAIKKDSGNAIVDEKNRIFKFKSDASLQSVGFFDFDTTKMKICLKNISPELLINEWKGDNINFSNTYSGECQEYYAFLLFKNGIMTKRGCLIGSFSIVSEEEIIREKKVK